MKNNKSIFIIISLALFIIIGFLYANPVLSGKHLFQHDIIQYKGGAKELLDHRAKYGEETYWSDSMFGGMPTYQMGAQFRGDVIKNIDKILLFFPKPVNYLFLLFSGFFFLGMVVIKNWKYALLGATFFGLSTYFYIIISAGHNGKLHTIAYFAPLLAGILLVYIRKKYLWGFITTTLFMGLQITANHPQMTYYLFLALGFLFLSELIRASKNKNWKHFLLSTSIVSFAFILGIGMNAQRMMANAEYVTETVRGKQILNTSTQSSEKSGMDKESMLMWSYGKMETLNLFIPRLMGGGSNEKNTEYRMEKIQQLAQENVRSQEEMNQISQGLRSLSYWGDQPGTSGPAYQGAVVIFLAILGFFFAKKKYRYWVLGASLLTIGLAWGSNFMPLSDFFIEYIPFYSKFRAPSSILVVVELLFPLMAIIGLYQFFTAKNTSKEEKQKTLLIVGSSVIGITLLLIIFGKSILGFSMEVERAYLPPYLLDYLVEERQNDFITDAIKAIVYVIIVVGAMLLGLKDKLNKNIVLAIIGIVSLFDLWTVNQRYLNNSHFVDKIFYENPFQTEITETIVQKVGDNVELQSVLSNANTNAILQKIRENDPTHYRIYNQVINPFGETNTSYFSPSVGGYHGVKLRRYDDLINTYFTRMDSVKVPKILNMLNTKYMIFGDKENPQAVPNPYANGNAWFVSEVKFVDSPNEEIEQIGVVDTKKIAIIANDDKKYFDKKTLLKDSTAHIKLTNYKANEITYQTQSKTPQLAIFSEIYYPKGWEVLVDGKKVDYIKANYLLRAVHLPAGSHQVKMVFNPKVIHQGKMISLISFFLFLLLSGVGIFMMFRKHKMKKAITTREG